MAKNKQGPESEPGNPDGCVIGKKEAKTIKSSVEVLSGAFIASAKKINSSIGALANKIYSIISKLKKVSLKPSGSGSKGGSGKSNSVIEGYNARIAMQTFKKEKTQKEKTQEAILKKAKQEQKDQISLRIAAFNKQLQAFRAEQRIIARARMGLTKLNISKAKKEKVAIIKAHNAAKKTLAYNIKKQQRAAEQAPLIAIRAMRALRALNRRKDAKERKAQNDILKRIEKMRRLLLSQKKEEERILVNARRALTALNKKNDKKRKESENIFSRFTALQVSKRKKELKDGASDFARYTAFQAKKTRLLSKARAAETRQKVSAEAKKSEDLANAIDELRVKFPRLTKLFIDGPAKLKEEFKYWSGVMSTGWSLASSVINAGAKLLRKGWDIAYKAVDSYINQDDYEGDAGDEQSQSNPTVNAPAETTKIKVDPVDNTEKEIDALVSKIEASQSKFNSIFSDFKDTIDNLEATAATDASAASALFALKDLADSFGKVDAKDFEEKFRIAGNAVIELARDLSIKEMNGEALTEAEKNLAEFAHKMTLLQPSEIAAQANKTILKSVEKLEAILKTKSAATKPATLASGGPATPSKDNAKGTDTVPAMLTPGEFVVNKDATKKNRGTLEQINNGGKTQKKASGGRISYLAKGTPSGGGGGSPAPGSPAPAAAVSPFIAGLTLAGKSLGVLSTVGNLAVGAITGTVGAFSKIVSFASPFVEAFNPALIEQMNLVFKDLTAVIGMALEPVIGAVIPIVRAFADRLVPVVQALIPTVQLFADAMIELAGPIIEILIEAFAALEPIIVLVADSVKIWAEILTWSLPLIAAVIKEVVWWFSKIATTIQWVIGRIMSMIPGTGDAGKKIMDSANRASQVTEEYYKGTSKVQKAVQQPAKKGASVGAAAGKASFSGISDLGRNLMQSAMSSSTQASAIRTAENTEKMDKTLTSIDQKMGRVPLPNPAAPARGARV